jgi:hypothetical protein
MLRFALRVIGFVSWVGAVALLVIDGTRSIAANDLETLSLSALLGERSALLEASFGGDHPILWAVLSGIMAHLPSSLFFMLMGAGALWLGRRRTSDDGLDYLA